MVTGVNGEKSATVETAYGGDGYRVPERESGIFCSLSSSSTFKFGFVLFAKMIAMSNGIQRTREMAAGLEKVKYFVRYEILQLLTFAIVFFYKDDCGVTTN